MFAFRGEEVNRKRAMTELWVERTGVRRYTGHSTRGAQVLVGNEDVEGVFTPGELMKIALAACSGMASDQPLQRSLGEDYQATIKVSGAADREQERYPLLEENLELDLSGLSEDEWRGYSPSCNGRSTRSARSAAP